MNFTMQLAICVDPDDGGELDDDHVRAFLSSKTLPEMNLRLRRCKRPAKARVVEYPRPKEDAACTS
jgi:hypothetical protein